MNLSAAVIGDGFRLQSVLVESRDDASYPPTDGHLSRRGRVESLVIPGATDGTRHRDEPSGSGWREAILPLSNTPLCYYDSNVLRLPADKRTEYHAQVDRLMAELSRSVRGKTEIKITKVVKAGSFAKFTILQGPR